MQTLNYYNFDQNGKLPNIFRIIYFMNSHFRWIKYGITAYPCDTAVLLEFAKSIAQLDVLFHILNSAAFYYFQ